MKKLPVIAIVLITSSAIVKADTLHNVATALDFAGFDARGSHNPLSGGVDLLIARQFNGNLFDFGAAELLVQGPISLQLSTGGRIVPGFDVALTTAVNAQNQPTNLNYNYFVDYGPQTTSVSGSMVIDANFSINALGFYDLSLASSSRNTVEREGNVNDTSSNDSDLGPIEVSGNIFVDALGILVDPLYEQAGRQNPFETIAKLIDLDSGLSLDLGSSKELALAGPFHSRAQSLLPARVAVEGVVVPEPTVLAMLLLGLPLVTFRTWRLRHN